MNSTELWAFKQAIRDAHGCRSRYGDLVTLDAGAAAPDTRDNHVYVFDLVDHPTAQQCYAWIQEVNGEKSFISILALPPMDFFKAAVQLALAAQANAKWGALGLEKREYCEIPTENRDPAVACRAVQKRFAGKRIVWRNEFRNAEVIAEGHSGYCPA